MDRGLQRNMFEGFQLKVEIPEPRRPEVNLGPPDPEGHMATNRGLQGNMCESFQLRSETLEELERKKKSQSSDQFKVDLIRQII
jgi:hypothetical protein